MKRKVIPISIETELSMDDMPKCPLCNKFINNTTKGVVIAENIYVLCLVHETCADNVEGVAR